MHFELLFDVDLSAVRIHTGAVANRLAADVGARAFALGNHVAFAAGQFAPDRPAGLHLLAHELTHTTQDRGTLRRSKWNLRGLTTYGDYALIVFLKTVDAHSLVELDLDTLNSVERQLGSLRKESEGELLAEIERLLEVELPDAREELEVVDWADEGVSYDPAHEQQQLDESEMMSHPVYETTLSSDDKLAIAEDIVEHKKKKRNKRRPKPEPKPSLQSEEISSEDQVSEWNFEDSNSSVGDSIDMFIVSDVLPSIRIGRSPDFLSERDVDIVFYTEVERRLRTDYLDGSDGERVAFFLNNWL